MGGADGMRVCGGSSSRLGRGAASSQRSRQPGTNNTHPSPRPTAVALTAGLVFCVYGVICLGRSFSPLPTPRKNHRLVTTGLYAHLRHPIYGGLILAALGLAAVTRSEGRLALAILMWVVLEYKAAAEEAALAVRYGADYKAYAARTTRKFLPFLY
jgi:protein-S-isoprenylcysteine O-methyltransferase Ste14